MEYKILSKINCPEDVKALPHDEILPLSEEIRAFMCEKVDKQGGHLASNLGVVELTLAIHRVFDCPKDHIIFDVGHQSYVHKILTGRKDGFDTLRTPGGLSGFTKRSESEYDAFGAGHSSTSLSAALGFAEADKLAGRDSYTVAVVGDGAYTGGMIHEALNNCRPKLNLVIILNENEMSISKNIGQFANQIAKIRSSKGYYRAKRRIMNMVTGIPLIGKFLFRRIARVKVNMKNRLYGSNCFEELGLYYLGPIDGNDYDLVERVLAEAKNMHRSTIIHIKTKKGKGYAPAEAEPAKYHGVPPKGSEEKRNFSQEFGDILCDMAREHGDICAITAAMSYGTGLEEFRRSFPKRFFDVGIAEEHAVTFAAGLAADGARPFFAVYSSFLQRAYDNILHDVVLQGLPVVLCVDRASLAPSDGATHHGIYDVAFLNTIPNIEIYTPSSFAKLKEALKSAYDRALPCAVRYPNSSELVLPESFCDEGDFMYDFKNEKPERVLITYGKIAQEALKAKKELDFGIVILEKIRPYSETAKKIKSILPLSSKLVFLEEGVYAGGAGMMLRDELKRDMTVLAIKDSFGEGKIGESLYESCGISAKHITEAFGR